MSLFATSVPQTLARCFCASGTSLAIMAASFAQPSPDADSDPDGPATPDAPVTITDVPATATQVPELDRETLPEVVRQLEQHGVEIVAPLNAPGGLQAYAAIAQQQPLAIYLTPDKAHIIIGTMMNGEGEDVTAQALEQATTGPWTRKTWEALRHSTWVLDGKPDAPRTLYMFTDPNCPFCHTFWQQSRPWVDSGAVQIHHVLVGILSESSPGKAAAILAASDPAQALLEHEQAGPGKGVEPLEAIPADITSMLDANHALMTELQVQGTPGILYFDADNQLQIQRGAPLDEDLEQILGPR